MEGPDDRPYYLTPNDVADWLKLNYKLGKQGHMAKSTIYNDYLELCEERGAKPIISPTFFGKLVKRAFPGIQSVRKGPRGQVRQCYARLKKRKNQLATVPHDAAGAYDGLSPAGAHHQTPTTTTPPLDLTVGQQQLHAAAYQQYYQQQFVGLHAAQYGLAGHHYAAYPGLAGQQHRTEVDRPAQQPQHYVDHHHLLQQQLPQLETVQHHLLALRGRVKEEQQGQHQYSGGGSGRGSREADDERSYGSPGQHHHHQAGSRDSSAVADGYGRGEAAADAASTHGSSPLLSSSLSSSSPAYNLLPPLQSSSLHQHSPLLYSAFHSPADAASHYGLRHHHQQPSSSSADDLSGTTSAHRTAYASALGSFSHFPTTSSISAHPPTPNYNNLDSSSSPNLLTSPTLPPPSPLFPPLPSSSSSSSSAQIYTPAHHQQHPQHQQSSTYPYYYRTSTEQHYTHTSSPPGSSPSSSQHLQSQAPPPAILHPPLTHPGGTHYAMRLTPLPPYPSGYTSLHSGAGGSDRAAAVADDTEGGRRGS